MIICQLLGADDAVQIGLHELLDDWMLLERLACEGTTAEKGETDSRSL